MLHALTNRRPNPNWYPEISGMSWGAKISGFGPLCCDTPRTYIAIGTTDPKVECFCQSNCLNNNYKLLSCLQVVTKQFQSVARIWESCQPSSTFSSTSTSSSTSATTSITLEKASPILHLPEARLESAKNWLVLRQFAHKRKDLSTPTFPWYARV